VLRFNALKRLYRLLIQYFSDVLNQNTSALEVPDLQAMAKDHSVKDTLIMCRLTIAIAVQCEDNKHIIDKIQSLSDTSQHYLMKAIEQVCERSPFVHLYPVMLTLLRLWPKFRHPEAPSERRQ
jgi:protein HOOK3